MNATLLIGQQNPLMMNTTNRKILVARRNSKQKSADKQHAADLVKWFEAVRSSILVEPCGDQLIHVRIYYPSGSCSTFKFDMGSSLEKLFVAACRSPDCPMYFRLYTTYPKTLVRCVPEWYHRHLAEMFSRQGIEEDLYIPATTFQEAGFPQTTVVMVEDCGA